MYQTFLPLGPPKSPLVHGPGQEVWLAYPSHIFFAKGGFGQRHGIPR
jgi:hypothetical protein